MEKIERILVVNRTRQYCREEVQVGISLARKYGADLLVLHLISNPVDMEALNAPLPFPDEHKSQTSIQDEACEELDKILKAETGSGFPLKIIIKDGDPVDEIVKVVRQEKVDLMVLVAHEQGRLEHMLFGRDNDEIIRSMPCSILLVKKEPEPVAW
ncbi:MAG: universal stress protein [Geobacteraceae bacterium GWC2_58_44]|nr:MAG: universal stress protein [Geobacteraceae bacterium GWC2_58_44]